MYRKLLLTLKAKNRYHLAAKVLEADLLEFIEKLSSYVKDYEKEGKPEFASTLKEIIAAVRKSSWEVALKLFRQSTLKYDLAQSYIYIQEQRDIQHLENQGLSQWGMKPGEYIAYRAGSVAKNPRGLYFAASYEDAKAYSVIGEGNRDVHKYLVDIKKPLIATRQEDAIQKLGGKPLVLSPTKMQRDLDAQLVRLLKKKGYDSALLTKPAPPALRELVVVDPGSIKRKLDE